GRIGVYSTKYRKEKGYKDAFESLDKSIDLEGKRSSPQVLDIYFQVAEVYMKNNNLPTDVIMDAYDKVSEVMELMIDESEMQLEAVMRQVYKLNEDLEAETIDNEKYLSDYEKLRTDSVQIANELTQLKNVGNNMDIRFSNHANCDMLIKTYGEKIKTSQDERTLKQIRKFFDKAKCTDNEIYEMAVEELHKIRPAANTAYFMGLIYFKKSKFTEALNYFKEAADMYEKEANIITASIMMAECYIKLGQYAAARETANKILRLNPTKGIAYILIGNAYMASVSSCNTTVPGAVYWAAADKYIKARTTDSSVTEEANRQLSTATARFPKIDDYFGLGLSKGESYSIGCWINETTTIR
ncbi:MAG: tetratricopeptide repeat protein, partial [Lentimicrobiaceae bacterium]|nr:tetratricopeptide repeat protein [Lentimicrobiaceae bacterium]